MIVACFEMKSLVKIVIFLRPMCESRLSSSNVSLRRSSRPPALELFAFIKREFRDYGASVRTKQMAARPSIVEIVIASESGKKKVSDKDILCIYYVSNRSAANDANNAMQWIVAYKCRRGRETPNKSIARDFYATRSVLRVIDRKHIK